MKISARNVLKGKITQIVHGMVNSEITIELPGGNKIISVITRVSADNLELQEGKEVYTIIKSSSVMLAVD